MSNLLNIGLVGCGYWGPNLARNFNRLQGCRLKRICDRDKNRLAHMAELYPNARCTTQYDKLIQDEEISAIAIATPVHTHYKLAAQSLQAGKHTFIEKPMASSVAQCVKLNQLASRGKRILMIGHTFIYSAAVQAIKKIIDSGDIGEVLYICSNRLNLGLFQPDINVTWDLAPHDISIVLYLLKDVPHSLNCQGHASFRPDIEDVTTCTLQFSDDKYVVMHSSWLDPNKVRQMKIIGSKKMIVYDDQEPLEKIKIFDKRVDMPPYYDSFAEFTYAYHYGDVYSPYVKQTEPLKTETQHFTDCIRTGQKPDSSGIEGLRVVQILEASSISLKNKGNNVPIRAFGWNRTPSRKAGVKTSSGVRAFKSPGNHAYFSKRGLIVKIAS